MADGTENARSERVEDLKVKVRELEDLIVALGRETTEAFLEAWKGRIDALRVQVDLGRMEMRDETAETVEDAEASWISARARLEALSDEAADVGSALIEGVRSARNDLRAAVELAQERVDAAAHAVG